MRSDRLLVHLTIQLTVLGATLVPALAGAGSLGSIEVYDRTAGHTLPIHEHEGRLYVAGEPRHQYELRIRNGSDGRVLAVTSVDGVNVINGKTAAGHQTGYVVGPWGTVEIEGWRKSLGEVATFYFTRLKDSYAARTGRPHNVGVIGVALFREQRPCCDEIPYEHRDSAAAPSGRAQESAAASSADTAARRRESESKLGTGHGHRESSPAQYVDFRRASSSPDEVITIYYDSRKNLVAQGVLPGKDWYADRRPDPFPNGFTPDP